MQGQQSGRGGKRLSALADYLLGYTYVGDGGEEQREGAQPMEGYVSDVCEMFGVGPLDALAALEHDGGRLVTEIAEYRVARRAVELMNAKGKDDKAAAFRAFESSPGLLHTLARMGRAQRGQPLTGPAAAMAREGDAMVRANQPSEDDDGGN